MQKFYAMLVLVAIAISLITITVYVLIFKNEVNIFAECRGGQVAGNIGGSFSLINQDGLVVTDIDVIKEPSLLYFGYTFCPDICPLDTYRNVEAVRVLDKKGFSVTPIFVTFDPQRDTTEVLKEFSDFMHPKMIALTGSVEQIKKITKKYRVYYKKQNNDDEQNYLIDHTAFTYLVLPEIGFVDFFRRELTAEQLADKVACFMRKI
ncbi:MAG: SCO family protein [Paracoccaceae bacterium]|nr:SCO family protein [Paracoccaceae bacterium]